MVQTLNMAYQFIGNDEPSVEQLFAIKNIKIFVPNFQIYNNMEKKPKLLIIAGPNGSGKTS